MHKSTGILKTHEKAFNELYFTNTLVKMIKNSCEKLEYNGEYYGLTSDNKNKLSAERNDYINMLTLISDRISKLENLNLTLEKEILL